MSPARLLLAAAVAGGALFGAEVSLAPGQITAMPLTTVDTQRSDYLPADPGYAPSASALPADGFNPATPTTIYSPQFATDGNAYYSPGLYPGLQMFDDSSWHCILFPHGWMYPAYLASMREPRLGAQVFHERTQGWLVDPEIGARVGFLRYGTDDLVRPEGFQLDVDTAVFPRFTLDSRREFQSEDFHVGVPLTLRWGAVEGKLAYAHYSSHLGDMYIEDTGEARSPYTRDSVVLGLAVRPREDFRLYAEADYAFHIFGNTRPWQFQFGIDWSTLQPTGFRGAPFFAINGMIRQDVNYGGNLTVQTGWQWRGQAGQSLRAGFHYFNGKSNQGQFFDHFEEQIGMGVWYDF